MTVHTGRSNSGRVASQSIAVDHVDSRVVGTVDVVVVEDGAWVVGWRDSRGNDSADR